MRQGRDPQRICFVWRRGSLPDNLPSGKNLILALPSGPDQDWNNIYAWET
jgi:hypothetical protein